MAVTTVVVSALTVVLLLMHVLGAARVLCSQSALRACKRALRCGRYRAKQEQEQDEVDDALKVEIKKERSRRRVAYARRGFCVLSVMGCAMLARGLVYALSGLTNPVSTAGMSLFAVAMCISAVHAVRPDLFSARTVNVWHVFLMALTTVHATPLTYESAEPLEFNSAIYTLLGVFCSVLNLNIRLSFFTNLALSIAMVYTCAHLPGPVNVLLYTARESVFFVARVALLYWVEHLLESSIKQEVQAKSLRGHKSATASLLQRMCDAVVEVDSDLRFVEHSPSLASMLFHGPGKNHQGAPMQDLLQSDDDKALFASSLSACGSHGGAPAAGMFHANLRDSWGTALGVEFFHVAYPALDDQLRHLVGIRSQQDKEPVSLSLDHLCEACRQALASQGVVNTQQTIAPAGAGPEIGAASTELLGFVAEGALQRARSRSRSRSASSGASSQRDTNTAIDVVAVDSLPVRYSSPKFVAKYGSVKAFLELVPDETQEVFQKWILSIADEIWSGTRRPQMEEFGCLAVTAVGASAPSSRQIVALFPPPKANTSREDYAVSIAIGKSVGASGNATGTRGTLAAPGAHGDLTRTDPQASPLSATRVCL